MSKTTAPVHVRPNSGRSAPLPQIEAALTRLTRLISLPRVHERVAAAAGVSLDRTAYPVLGRLDELGPSRLSDLAAALGLDLSTVSRQVGHLESKGLVGRRTDPNDRRASAVDLTRRGRDVLARVRRVRSDVLTEALSGWSAADQRRFATLFGRFIDSVASHVEPGT